MSQVPETIDIAVVPRDRFSTFPRCLDALYANTRVPFRLIVVAGGLDVHTEQQLRQRRAHDPNLTLVLADHLLTQAEARNIALHHVREDRCVILENDTIVHQDWLPPLVECMRRHGAAAVTPLILWYRGIHAAGCTFEEVESEGRIVFRHGIDYSVVGQRRIDYPENHCLLIDRRLLPDIDLFEDVEPFDVDFGLLLRQRGLAVFLEAGSVVTYSAPPPWEVRDIPAFKFRWDPTVWGARNRRFADKWGVTYDSTSKQASYRRQQIKLGLARWYSNRVTVGIANAGGHVMNRIATWLTSRRESHWSG